MRRRRWPALLALAGLACDSLTDPALPHAARLLTPPAIYARWWSMTEACSGLSRDMSAITWYVTPGSTSISDGHGSAVVGYYSPLSNRIVLADTAYITPTQIRHEMLHALLGPSVSGHPRDQFLGRCLGVVSCYDGCVSDAGPPPPPDPAAVTIASSDMIITGAVDPAAPTLLTDDGWFTFTVFVTNPRSTPVSVMDPGFTAPRPATFSWDVECVPAFGTCMNVPGVIGGDSNPDTASFTRFAPHETKRFVFDFQIGRYPPLSAIAPVAYALTGFYNAIDVGGSRQLGGPASAPDTVFVTR